MDGIGASRVLENRYFVLPAEGKSLTRIAAKNAQSSRIRARPHRRFGILLSATGHLFRRSLPLVLGLSVLPRGLTGPLVTVFVALQNFQALGGELGAVKYDLPEVSRMGRAISAQEPRHDRGVSHSGASYLSQGRSLGRTDRGSRHAHLILANSKSSPHSSDPIDPEMPGENLTNTLQEVMPVVHPYPAPAVQLPKGKGAKARIAAIEVLLDRIGISSGVIDGRGGSNVNKAVSAFEEMTGQKFDPLNEEGIDISLEQTGGPAFISYMITPQDTGYPFVASIPEDYSHKAQLERMAYTSITEMLGERFHMDEAYLKEINPGADFNKPGTVIKVANRGQDAGGAVRRIIADKGRKQVRGYNANGRLVVAYPATIGSLDNPSPSGIVQIERVVLNPNYTYNPKINFKQGENDKILTIPPGPNGPVGTVWIAMSKPTYGIHGTPDPSKVGKTSSHGCVRLANWDAAELSQLVQKGVSVEFQE